MHRTALTCTSIAALGLLGAAALVTAGPLNPPPGSVAPTLKTLVEVEPRIAVNAANTPGDATALFRITQPGSYYLTGNVAGVSGRHGILIAASGVTLDLNGFELLGATGSRSGIAATSPGLSGIAISNGSIRLWGESGVDLGQTLTTSTRLEALRVAQCTASGIIVGDQSHLIGCAVTLCGGTAMLVGMGGTVVGCTVARNSQTGLVLGSACIATDVVSQSNGATGILAGVGCSLTRCVASFNTGTGILVSATGTTVHSCNAQFNGDDGIRGRAVFTDCTATFNSGDGIDAFSGSTIEGCIASANGLNGIRLDSVCRAVGNTCDSNGGAGLFSGIFTQGDRNRIEANHVTGNDFGIGAGGLGHVIIRNYAGGNTNNYSLPASGSFIGDIVGTSAAMNAANNDIINISN